MDSDPQPSARADIAIRPAVSGDADAIAAMIADLANTLKVPESQVSRAEDMLGHGFGDARRFEALLAEQDDVVVGLVLYFYNFSSWRGRLGLYVQDIHVVERLRGTGLGRALLAAAVRAGRAEGCTHLRLSVHSENRPARRFYERMGLAPCHDEVIYQAAGTAFEDMAGDLG